MLKRPLTKESNVKNPFRKCRINVFQTATYAACFRYDAPAALPHHLTEQLDMRSSIHRVTATIITIIVGAVFIHAQTPVAVKNAKASGSVSGRITTKGKSLAGIAVALRYPNRSSPFETLPRAVTDQDGNYKINNVAAGSYEVEFGAIAYVMADNAASSHSVVVGDGENMRILTSRWSVVGYHRKDYRCGCSR